MGRQALEVGELSKTVAKLLESARDEQGVSYRELQQRSGINRMRAQRILTEERPFTVDEVNIVSATLGFIGWKVVRDAARSIRPSLSPAPHLGEESPTLKADESPTPQTLNDTSITVNEYELAADSSRDHPRMHGEHQRV